MWSCVEILTSFQDKHQQRLLIKFRVVNCVGVLLRGIAGSSVNFGTGSVAVSNAAIQAIRETCTRGFGAPYIHESRKHHVSFDETLYSHVKAVTELWCAVAASYEQAAMRQIGSGHEHGIIAEHTVDEFEGVCFVQQDSTHAQTRTVKRPFAASPQLRGILAKFIFNKYFIINVVNILLDF